MAMMGCSVINTPHDPSIKDEDIKLFHCEACGTQMVVSRSVLGFGSYSQALSGEKSLHDIHKCPHADAPWHGQSEKIWLECQKTASPSLKKMLQLDMAMIAIENLKPKPQDP